MITRWPSFSIDEDDHRPTRCLGIAANFPSSKHRKPSEYSPKLRAAAAGPSSGSAVGQSAPKSISQLREPFLSNLDSTAPYPSAVRTRKASTKFQYKNTFRYSDPLRPLPTQASVKLGNSSPYSTGQLALTPPPRLARTPARESE